jgi:hypothetical protein
MPASLHLSLSGLVPDGMAERLENRGFFDTILQQKSVQKPDHGRVLAHFPDLGFKD